MRQNSPRTLAAPVQVSVAKIFGNTLRVHYLKAKEMVTITCPRCKTKNPDDRNTCQKCGLNIRLINRLIFRLIQIVLLALLLALSAGGIAIMYTQPLSVITCRYVESKQVNCQLQERIAWVISLREIPITHLKKAFVKTETRIREDEDGDEYTVLVDRVVLLSASGERTLKGYDDIGSSAKLTAARINDYLNTPTVESLTIWGFGLWGHTLATLAGGLVFILFALIVVVAIIDMVVGLDTKRMKIRG